MYFDDFLNVDLEIHRLLNRNNIDKALASNLSKVITEIDKTIASTLPELGKLVVKEITRTIRASEKDPSRNYVFVDEEGNQVDTHTSSEPGGPPSSFSGNLEKSISYQIRKNSVWITISKGKAKWNTLMYIPLARLSKRSPWYDALIQYKGQYRGAIVVSGSGGTPVREYAMYLEKGFHPHVRKGKSPFVHRPFFEETMISFKEISWAYIKKVLKEKVQKKFSGKKIPVSFWLEMK